MIEKEDAKNMLRVAIDKVEGIAFLKDTAYYCAPVFVDNDVKEFLRLYSVLIGRYDDD